jgi:hypothetical protein
VVTTLDSGQRTARKQYRCGLCNITIKPGDRHAFQTNVYDGRVYTWRDCIWCDRDGILGYVHDWTGGYYDEGVNYEQAVEWAEDAALWPRSQFRPSTISGHEQRAARNWLARAAGDE